MEQKILITGYKSYNFKDTNGDNQSGVKISYLASNNNTDTISGYLPIQQSLPYDFLKVLKGAGVYIAKLEFGVGAGNKATIKIVDLKFVKEVNFSDFLK